MHVRIALACVVLVAGACTPTVITRAERVTLADADARMRLFGDPAPRVGERWLLVDTGGAIATATVRSAEVGAYTCSPGRFVDVVLDVPSARTAGDVVVALGPLASDTPRARLLETIDGSQRASIARLVDAAYAPPDAGPAPTYSATHLPPEPRSAGEVTFEDDIVEGPLEHPDGEVLPARRATPRVEAAVLVDLDGDGRVDLVQTSDLAWWRVEPDRLAPLGSTEASCSS